MIIEFYDVLPIEYKEDIKYLLMEADKDFIPPLSQRLGSTQMDFSLSNNSSNIDLYFKKILKQPFLLAIEEDNVVGFMSFIYNHHVDSIIETLSGNSLYISTIIVNKKFRNNSVSTLMYKKLLREFSDRIIFTRTWSLNYPHLHILSKFGFNEVKCVRNDRGKGIDTVYYLLFPCK